MGLATLLTAALRWGRDTVSGVDLESCGKIDQKAVNLISLGSFAEFRSFDQEIDGVNGTTRNEKTPVGAEELFCTLCLACPAQSTTLRWMG